MTLSKGTVYNVSSWGWFAAPTSGTGTTATIDQWEDRTKRTQLKADEIGLWTQRTYNIAPEGGAEPTRGDIMPGYTGTEDDILKPRVVDYGWQKQTGGSQRSLVVTYLQPIRKTGETVLGDYIEARGSRHPKQDKYHEIITPIIGVAAATTSSGLPAVGDFIDSTGLWSNSHGTYSVGDIVEGDGSPDSYFYECTVEHTAAVDKEPPNTSYWRRCGLQSMITNVQLDDSIPGIVLVRATAVQVKAYSEDSTDTLDMFEYGRTRDIVYQGKRYYADRRWYIPTDLLAGLESSWKPDDDNVYPGFSTQWSALTDYVADDLVQGDGSPDSRVYKCILANGPGGVGAQEPPNATYWTRVTYAAYIRKTRVERDSVERPGQSNVQALYAKPDRRRLLRDNPGKLLYEGAINANVQTLVAEPTNAANWVTSTAYEVNDLVYDVGFKWKCMIQHTSGAATRPPNDQYWRRQTKVIEGKVIGRKWHTSVSYAKGDIVNYTDSTGKSGVFIALANPPTQGEYPGETAGHWKSLDAKWQVIGGSNSAFFPRAIIKLGGTATSAQINTYVDMFGCTNSAAMTNLPHSPAADTMLLIGYQERIFPDEEDLYEVGFVFLYEKGTWTTNGCTVQQFQRFPEQADLLDKEGVATGDTVRRLVWMPKGDPESRTVTRGQVSMAAINSAMDWDA